MKLIVIDMQKALLVPELYNLNGLLKNISKLIKVARKNNVEVIYVQHDAGPNTGFTKGDEGFKISDEIKPNDDEKVFVKKINSVFGCHEFKEYLEKEKEDSLMIVGLQTNYCIDATIKSAFERGYQVIIPEKSNSTFNNPYMTGKKTYEYYYNEVWPEIFGKCVTMDEAIQLLTK